jgi:hypothetical protein
VGLWFYGYLRLEIFNYCFSDRKTRDEEGEKGDDDEGHEERHLCEHVRPHCTRS